MGKGAWFSKNRKQGGGGGSDLSSARGFPCVAGSCDTVREREAARELVTLVQEAVDRLYPDAPREAEAVEEGDLENKNQTTLSIQDELVREISSVKAQSSRSAQRVVSVQTGIRGFVVVKIQSKAVCPVRIVTSIFDRVRQERLPVARHLVKLLPLQHTFYPNQELMDEALSSFVGSLFRQESSIPDGVAAPRRDDEGTGGRDAGDDVDEVAKKRRKTSEGLEDVQSSAEVHLPDGVADALLLPAPPASSASDAAADGPSRHESLAALRPYTILFNRRSHDVITRHIAIAAIRRVMPRSHVYNYRDFKDVFLIEVFRNLAGMSYIEGVPSDAVDFNIRKFQLGLLGSGGGGGGAKTKSGESMGTKEDANDLDDSGADQLDENDDNAGIDASAGQIETSQNVADDTCDS